MLEDSKTILELNLELLETAAIAAQELLNSANENNIEFPERQVLWHLLMRSASILNAIRRPYEGRLPLSEENLQRKRTDADLTAPFRV